MNPVHNSIPLVFCSVKRIETCNFAYVLCAIYKCFIIIIIDHHNFCGISGKRDCNYLLSYPADQKPLNRIGKNLENPISVNVVTFGSHGLFVF